MTLPTMRSGLDRRLTDAWCAAIDEGPFRSLAVGERLAFDNLEMHTALSYAAARTERVRIAPTIVILPMHPVAVAAKQLATLDVLSGGRVDVVVGVGGRDQDYRCAERSFSHRHQRLDEQVAELRRLWAGGAPHDGASVGPEPVQPGGPPVYASALGPKSIARAARWADGNLGFTLAPDTDDHELAFGRIREAWADAGRVEQPRISTSFWYSVDDADGQALRAYAYRYLEVFGSEAAAMMADMCTAAGLDAVAAGLDRLEAAGCDEVYLVPTTVDPAHLADVAALRS
ncbi:MAG: LLM class flavin-dependent oxidoreductase [Acidimicrobiales bacterium]